MSKLDKKQTFTGLFFSGLLETDMSIRSSKKQAAFMTNSMHEYNMHYWNWKHNYRTRYNEKFIKDNGFVAETAATISSTDDDAVKEYILSLEPDLDKVKSSSIAVPGVTAQMFYYLQENEPTWLYEDKTLEHGGEIYELDYISYKEEDDPNLPDDTSIIVANFICISDETLDDIQIETDNLYEDTICLVATYTLTGSTNTLFYIEPEDTLSSTLYVDKEISMTPVVQLKANGRMVTDSKKVKKMMNKLNVNGKDFEEAMMDVDDDGEPQIDEAYLINGLPLTNPYEIKPGFYSLEQASQFPTGFLIKVGHDMASNGEDHDVLNGYRVTQEVADKWYDKHMREQAYLAKGLFKTFAYYAGAYLDDCTEKRSSPFYLGHCVRDVDLEAAEPIEEEESTDPGDFVYTGQNNGSKNIPTGRITFTSGSNFSASYNFDISIRTEEGRVRPDIVDKRSQATFHFSGTTITTKNEDGDRSHGSTPDAKGYDLIEIKVQIDENTYQVMEVRNFSANFRISRTSFQMTAGYPKSEVRLMIPYFVIQKLNFSEFVTIHEQSFCVVAYSIKVVVTKWYKRFLGVFIGILLCLGTLGAGCGIAVLLYTIVVAVAVTLISEWIMANIDSDLLKVILILALSLATMGLNGFDFSLLTVENYLPIAQQVAGAVYNFHKMKEAEVKAKEEKEEKIEEGIEDRIENADSIMNPVLNASLSAHYSYMESNGPDQFFSTSLGDGLFNFSQYFDVDENIELRKQVKSG